jgi:hypothetical protein
MEIAAAVKQRLINRLRLPGSLKIAFPEPKIGGLFRRQVCAIAGSSN